MPDQLEDKKISVLLIVDSPILHQGIRSAIAENKDIEVVMQVGSSYEPFTITDDIMPRTVAVFVITPRNSIRMVYRLKEVAPDISVIVLAPYYDDDWLFQSVRAGVSAFIATGSDNERLVDAIRQVYDGERLVVEDILSRSHVARRILGRFNEFPLAAEGATPLLSTPSPMEDEILHRLAAEDTIEAITNYLKTSKEVIQTRIESILRKLEANERTVGTIWKIRSLHSRIKIDE